MAKYTIEDTTLTSIADAIRTKGNTTESLTPTQMPDAINAIEAGTTNEGVAALVGTGFMPSSIDGYASGGRRYYTTSSYQTVYYWYRSSNTNVYWQVCAWSPSKFKEGHKYRMTTWIWHDGAVSDEPIAFHQSNIFFNGSVSVPNPLADKGITTTPQLLSITFDYVANSSYGAVFYIYPVDSGNQVRLLPIIVEDLTSPDTSYGAVAV